MYTSQQSFCKPNFEKNNGAENSNEGSTIDFLRFFKVF